MATGAARKLSKKGKKPCAEMARDRLLVPRIKPKIRPAPNKIWLGMVAFVSVLWGNLYSSWPPLSRKKNFFQSVAPDFDDFFGLSLRNLSGDLYFCSCTFKRGGTVDEKE